MPSTCHSHQPESGRNPQSSRAFNARPNGPDLRVRGLFSHTACAVIMAGPRGLQSLASETAQP